MHAKVQEKSSLEHLIQKWGCAASEAVLDFPCLLFQIPEVDGVIGYRVQSSCAVAIGDPICAKDELPRLTEAFYHYCQANRMNMIFIITSAGFAKWVTQHFCHALIEVGEELIFNPQFDPKEGPRGRRLRYKVSHVEQKGLEVREYLGEDPTIEQAMQQVGAAWLNNRTGPQIHLGHLDFFAHRSGKRWFYVKDKEQILGVALLCRLDACDGWLLKFLMVVPEAPRGTSEFLMSSLLDILRSENCHCLTYGIVPGIELGEITGIGRFSAWMVRKLFKIIRWLFKLDHRKLYWQKFRPKAEPSYVVFGTPNLSLKEVRAIINSLQID